MKTEKFFAQLSLNIMVIFLILIASSFVPDLFPKFFEDWFCGGWTEKTGRLCFYVSDPHDPTWHWGFRHFMWFFMGFALFGVQVARLAVFVNKKIKEVKK